MLTVFGKSLLVFSAALAVLVAGCAQPASYSAPGGAAEVYQVPEYRLGPGDRVRVDVFGQEALSSEYSVESDNNLSMPLIGDVPARGRTAPELSDAITAALAAGYLLQPRVTVTILTLRPFYILGEVNKPSEYPTTSGLTVLNAVATAGGFTYRADSRNVYIKHENETTERRVPLDASTPVLPGDTIRVGERFF